MAHIAALNASSGKIASCWDIRSARSLCSQLWIAGAGILVGILAGLFGIGGGAIIVPVLYEVFGVLDVPEDVRMQLCIGTSLAIIVPTTVRSYHRAQKEGRGDSRSGAHLDAAGGGRRRHRLGDCRRLRRRRCSRSPSSSSPRSSASSMLFGGDRWNLGDDLPGRGLLALYGFITGLFSSLVGVSGGAVSNAVLTLYGQPMQRAVATSAGIGVPITIAGTIGYMLAGWPHMAQLPPLSIGFVSLIGFVLMAPVSSYTASYGVRLAHWLPRRKLEIAFGVFLLLVCAALCR